MDLSYLTKQYHSWNFHKFPMVEAQLHQCKYVLPNLIYKDNFGADMEKLGQEVTQKRVEGESEHWMGEERRGGRGKR